MPTRMMEMVGVLEVCFSRLTKSLVEAINAGSRMAPLKMRDGCLALRVRVIIDISSLFTDIFDRTVLVS